MIIRGKFVCQIARDADPANCLVGVRFVPDTGEPVQLLDVATVPPGGSVEIIPAGLYVSSDTIADTVPPPAAPGVASKPLPAPGAMKPPTPPPMVPAHR